MCAVDVDPVVPGVGLGAEVVLGVHFIAGLVPRPELESLVTGHGSEYVAALVPVHSVDRPSVRRVHIAHIVVGAHKPVVEPTLLVTTCKQVFVYGVPCQTMNFTGVPSKLLKFLHHSYVKQFYLQAVNTSTERGCSKSKQGQRHQNRKTPDWPGCCVGRSPWRISVAYSFQNTQARAVFQPNTH